MAEVRSDGRLQSVSLPARAAHHAARCRPGVLAVFEDLYAVDQHVNDTGRILVGPIERGMVLDRCRVKNHHVREITRSQPPAPRDPEISAPPWTHRITGRMPSPAE